MSELAQKIAQLTHDEGGASVGLNGTNYSGRRGYAVSIYKERQRIIPGYPTADDVEDYISQNIDILDDDHSDYAPFVGTWFHRGKTYFDVSVRVSRRLQAVRLGKEHSQIAVFDLLRFEDVAVA